MPSGQRLRSCPPGFRFVTLAVYEVLCSGLQDQEREASVISEKLAEDGDVDGSMAKVAEAEALQQRWKELLDSYTQPDRTMSVCDICGVFVQSTDNEQRRLVRPPSTQRRLRWQACCASKSGQVVKHMPG